MSSRSIEAGRAFVRIGVKDDLSAALKRIQKQMAGFGRGVSQVGKAVGMLGGAIAAPLTVALAKFSAAGDALDKMSLRTNTSVEALSELGFAAEQSGASIDQVGSALFRMQRRIANASTESGPAIRALRELGLSAEELTKLSPDRQMEVIADRLGSVGNEALAAQYAFEIFGDGAKSLMPMLKAGSAGIQDLREEARALGRQMTTSDATAAAEFADAWNRVKSAASGATMQLGAALAPAASEVANALSTAVAAVSKFLSENRSIIRTVAKVAAILVGVGAALVGVGTAFIVASALIGSVTTIAAAFSATLGLVASMFGLVVSGIGAVLSPIGLLVAGLAYAGYQFFDLAGKGKAAVSDLAQKVSAILGPIRETFGKTFEGIRRALAGGELAAAGKIVMTGLRLAVAQSLGAIHDTFGETIGKIVGQIAGGDLAGAWETVVLGMSDVWASFTSGVVNMFADAASAVIDTWKKTIDRISNMILQKAGEGGAFGSMFEKISGVNVAEEMEREQKLQKQAEEMGLGSRSDPLFDQIRQGTYSDPHTQKIADRLKARLEDMKKSSEDASTEAASALRDHVGGASAGLSGEIAMLEKQLDDLVAKQTGREGTSFRDLMEGAIDETNRLSDSVSNVGTFSGFAALRGTGDPTQDRIAKAAEETRDAVRDSNRKLDKLGPPKFRK